MNRRTFIRLVGGGIVFSASTGLTACSREMPPEAIAAWQGPKSRTDLRKWILSYAILAPHSHNLQSWLVDLRTPNEIMLYCDRARLLPETDPYNRQIMMSHGTFLELVDMAARQRGIRTNIELFPQGEFGPDEIDQRPVARIRLRTDPSIAKDPLFEQILKRHTNRKAYDMNQAVPARAVQKMADSVKPYPIRFGFAGLDQPDILNAHRRIAAEAWRIELTTPAKILETYAVLRIGASEIAKHRDGISINDPFLSLLVRLGFFDRSKAPGPDDSATVDQIEKFNKNLDSTPGFLWMVTDGNDRKSQINAGRAYVRVQLTGTAHGISMQPLQQALQEYPEQAGEYQKIHKLFDAPPPRYTVQMWARVGYGPKIEPAPRRGLEAHIVA
ncbi:twin-arginine translocation pathway signal protein [Alkalispirochaeta odontotermitis]|nr:twin-arginine translocation pathway signal protein [Alkalispirochaeta odontotermitis]CAB1074749.1 hypothetical protein D1AOALGA4SA_2568 [Olavius algarvensis Delta 1 endosymbiont]